MLPRMVPGEQGILTQLRRGALEYCVLALLERGETYGLDIARRLGADRVLLDGEGTLYPLLARLRKAGLVDTRWQESIEGPPRRYYVLTREGHDSLEAFRCTWKPFRDAVDHTLSRGSP